MFRFIGFIVIAAACIGGLFLLYKLGQVIWKALAKASQNSSKAKAQRHQAERHKASITQWAENDLLRLVDGTDVKFLNNTDEHVLVYKIDGKKEIIDLYKVDHNIDWIERNNITPSINQELYDQI